MSYIRCTSNPEGLYIWAGARGFSGVHICHSVKPPLASEQMPMSGEGGFTVPEASFKAVCHKWSQYGPKVSSRGFSAENVLVAVKNGRTIDGDKPIHDIWKRGVKTEYRVFLRYKDHFVMLWSVTWLAVVESVLRED